MSTQRTILICTTLAAQVLAAAAEDVRLPETAPDKTDTARLMELAGTQGFVPYHGNPVISPGAEGEWDAAAFGSLSVILVGGKDLHAISYGPRNHFDAKGCYIRVALFRGKLESLVPDGTCD